MRLQILPLTAALAVAAWAGTARQEKQPPEKAAAAQPEKPAAAAKKDYVGSETCAGCHDEISTAFKKNPHFVLESNRRGWATKACEACHGPGSVHAETNLATDIRSPKQMTAAAIDALCLNCHKNQATHVGRVMSSHARNSIACTSCHNMHKKGEESSEHQLKTNAGVNKLCTSCHFDVKASFAKPHKHKVNENAMSCTSCHNPHTSFMNKNLRLVGGAEPSCFRCHSDKRGPFVFEHAPVQNEPCSTCHEPHGSANPRMLKRAEVAPLCLECHSNVVTPPQAKTVGGIPPAIHDLRSPRFRNCTICHQKIHGSNVNGALTR